MVKAYLKYVQRGVLGVVATTNAVFDASEKSVFVGALERCVRWDVKLGARTASLRSAPAATDSAKSAPETTVVALSPAGDVLATGHIDGSVRIWRVPPDDHREDREGASEGQDGADEDLMEGEEEDERLQCTLSGHRSAVTCLRFDADGGRLASGSKDTDVVVWDVTGERGLFRLGGHTGEVTSLCWLGGETMVSTSRDTTAKVWDVRGQRCQQTLPGHRSEVLCCWAFVRRDVDPDDVAHQWTVLTGSADGRVRMWEESRSLSGESEDVLRLAGELVPPVSGAGEETTGKATATAVKVSSILVSEDGELMACVVGERVACFYRVLTDPDVEKKRKRKERRAKGQASKKLKKEPRDDGMDDDEEGEQQKDEEEAEAVSPEERFSYLWPLRAGGKIRSLALSKKAERALLSLNNNSMEIYGLLDTGKKNPEANMEVDQEAGEHFNLLAAFTQAGHRADIRSMALTTDDATLVTVANGSTKIWSLSSGHCMRTVECGYGLCTVVVPGNRYCVVGTKEGRLQVIDVHSGMIAEEIEAHTGAIWSVCALPDGSGIVTGSADQKVKHWDFDLVKAGSATRLSLKLGREAEMDDDVLCVRVSPDGALLAAALLDSTVKVYKNSGTKFFLSLYGHKLPVLAIDISDDSRLLVSGSADKNIRIWGLDFGDCHRSLFAHGDSVMQVAFVQQTHYAFSVGKDGLCKYWDADKFEQIQALDAQRGAGSACWCLAVGGGGEMVITAGHDKSIRVWRRTREQLFLEEEKDKQLDAQFEANLEEQEDFAARNDPTRPESEAATRKSLATIRSGEVLLEALELVEEEEAKRTVESGEDAPAPNILLLGMSDLDYLLSKMASIPASHMEQALLLLPWHHVSVFLRYCRDLVRAGKRVELCTQCLAFLLKLHHAQITASQDLLPVLEELSECAREHLQRQKDIVGFNAAALRFMKQELEAEGTVSAMFEDAETKLEQIKLDKKKAAEEDKKTKNRKNKAKKKSATQQPGAEPQVI